MPAGTILFIYDRCLKNEEQPVRESGVRYEPTLLLGYARDERSHVTV